MKSHRLGRWRFTVRFYGACGNVQVRLYLELAREIGKMKKENTEIKEDKYESTDNDAHAPQDL